MIVSGGKVIDQCGWCGQWVTLNKTFLGSLHICLTEEERQAKTAMWRQQASMQRGQLGSVGGHVDLKKLLSQLGGNDLVASASKPARTHTKSAQSQPTIKEVEDKAGDV